MLTRLHHVGQIVPDYDAALAFHRDVLGVAVDDTAVVDDKVKLAFTGLPNCEVHLIAREERGSRMDDLLDTLLDVSPYHLAYAVEDIHDAIDRAEELGIELYDDEPTSGLREYERAFVRPGSNPGLPFEFIELDDTN